MHAKTIAYDGGHRPQRRVNEAKPGGGTRRHAEFDPIA